MRRLLGAAAIAGALLAGVTAGTPAASAAPAAPAAGGWVPYATCYYGNTPVSGSIYHCDALITLANQVNVQSTLQFVETVYPQDGSGAYNLYLFYVWEN